MKHIDLLSSMSLLGVNWPTIHNALTVLEDCFGHHCLSSNLGKRGYFFIARIRVGDCNNLPALERAVSGKLDAAGWHMATLYLLDRTRFKRMGTDQVTPCDSNVYGLVPFSDLQIPCPTRVFHATWSQNIEGIRRDGLKPSQINEYRDTEGKLHVCQKLDGGEDSATKWAKLLSESRNMPMTDYSILEINLSGIDTRSYIDLHGLCGAAIVLDQFDSIPFNQVTAVYSYNGIEWMKNT